MSQFYYIIWSIHSYLTSTSSTSMPLTPCYSACQSTSITPGLSQQEPTNVKDLIQVQTSIHTCGSGKEAKPIITDKPILVICYPGDYWTGSTNSLTKGITHHKLATSKKSAVQIYCILETKVPEDAKSFKVHDILTIDIIIVLLKLYFRQHLNFMFIFYEGI